MSQLAILPESGIGNVWSETYSCSADTRKMSNNCTRLFLYVPGNGLCAYDITDSKVSGTEDIQIEITTPMVPIEYYNLHGVRVNAENLTPGIYITRQGAKTAKVLIK
jgi:hypothetical protein